LNLLKEEVGGPLAKIVEARVNFKGPLLSKQGEEIREKNG